MFDNIKIQSHQGPYEVKFEKNLSFLDTLFSHKSHFYVIDKKVSDLYRESLKTLPEKHFIFIEAIENNKDLIQIPQYLQELTDLGLKRDSTLVAIGGGITQDITCFMASIVFRGIPWKFVPTTLLAQSDSCIGSKSSINCSGVKNLVGNFTPPKNIYLCLDFLNTLSQEEIHSGIGEIVKVHMVKGFSEYKTLMGQFDNFQQRDTLLESLYHGLLYKKELIEIDEFDRGPRNIMNYGHTFGHAIEKATDHKIPHGIAVAMGMDMANHYSSKFGLTDDLVVNTTGRNLKSLYQSYSCVSFRQDLFYSAIKKDKKNVGDKITLIVPQGQHYKLSKYPAVFDESFKNFCQDFFSNWRSQA